MDVLINNQNAVEFLRNQIVKLRRSYERIDTMFGLLADQQKLIKGQLDYISEKMDLIGEETKYANETDGLSADQAEEEQQFEETPEDFGLVAPAELSEVLESSENTQNIIEPLALDDAEMRSKKVAEMHKNQRSLP